MDLRFGNDLTWSPTVWIVFVAREDLKSSNEKITDLRRVAGDVRSEIIYSGTERWPYVKVATEWPPFLRSVFMFAVYEHTVHPLSSDQSNRYTETARPDCRVSGLCWCGSGPYLIHANCAHGTVPRLRMPTLDDQRRTS